MKNLKLDRAPRNSDLDSLEIGGIIEVHGIRQDLPDNEYHPLRVRSYLIAKHYELGERKLRITVPKDRYGRRYVLIKRTK